MGRGASSTSRSTSRISKYRGIFIFSPVIQVRNGKEQAMQNGKSLEERRIVVLGGSSGIGLAVAELAASKEFEVVIASSNATKIHAAIKAIGERAHGEVVDVSNERAVEDLFAGLGASITLSSPQGIACK